MRLGLIGAGAVGMRHARAAGDALRAVCDVNEESARRAGGEVYTDYRAMLAGAALDAVVITSPHALHAEMTVAAAEHGLHVLVEKPMATTLPDCDRMIEACERAGVVLAVGHVSRFDASIAAAARLVAAGTLGPVLGLTHRRSSHYQPGSRPGWFFDPALAGGGIVINVGTHGLDRIQLLGGGSATRVTARIRARDGLAVETDCFALVELDNGVPATVVLTSAAVPYADETLVLGERGSLRWSATDGLWLSRDGGPEEPVDSPPADAFAAQLDDFFHACRTGSPPLIDGPYGRSVLAAVLAVYESAATGDPVRVPQFQRLA